MLFVKKYSNIGITSVVIFVSLIFIALFSAPINRPVSVIVTIEDGMSSDSVSEIFVKEKLIRSSFVFNSLLKLSGGKFVANDYFFNKDESMFQIVSRLRTGYSGIKPVRIVIFEGMTTSDMAETLERNLENFNKEEFITLSSKKEGYLFPDTYFISPYAKPSKVIKQMENNFASQIENLQEEIDKTGKSLNEIITMASLLEKEAANREDKEMIAGILWKRIDDGMLLQVDAVFPYIIGKNTFEVTLDDLATDSPYNTYRYKGLPPGPIANPGLESIKAAMYPKESNYWFYLSDLDGNMHYAVTFEQHKINKARYLK